MMVMRWFNTHSTWDHTQSPDCSSEVENHMHDQLLTTERATQVTIHSFMGQDPAYSSATNRGLRTSAIAVSGIAEACSNRYTMWTASTGSDGAKHQFESNSFVGQAPA